MNKFGKEKLEVALVYILAYTHTFICKGTWTYRWDKKYSERHIREEHEHGHSPLDKTNKKNITINHSTYNSYPVKWNDIEWSVLKLCGN